MVSLQENFYSSNYAAEVVDKPTKSQSQARLFGVIASLNYTYNDIYLLDASARFDGSSEFGSNQNGLLSGQEVWVSIFIITDLCRIMVSLIN